MTRKILPETILGILCLIGISGVFGTEVLPEDTANISKAYKFKAVPVPNGGDIDIDYKIAQRD